MLNPQYFCKLFQFIGKKNREQTAEIRAKLTTERRKHYKANNMEAYESVVKQALEIEDQEAKNIMKAVTDALDISEQEFGMTYQTLMQNPQIQQFLMMA